MVFIKASSSSTAPAELQDCRKALLDEPSVNCDEGVPLMTASGELPMGWDWRVPLHQPGEFDGDPLAERYFCRLERDMLDEHPNTPVPYPTCAKARPAVPHHLPGFEEIDMHWRPPPVPVPEPVPERVLKKLEAAQIPFGVSFRLVQRLESLTEMSLVRACHRDVVRPD